MKAKSLKAKIWPRVRDDWYTEPDDCVAALHRVDPIAGPTWDPACGSGSVVRTLQLLGIPAVGTDLVLRPGMPEQHYLGRHDFLGDVHPQHLGPIAARNIVTNPPFGRGRTAEAFIRRAVHMVHTGKVAVFLPVRFLGGDARAAGLWAELPPARVWWLTPRPSCPPGEYLLAGGKAEGGTADFCWVVWHGVTAPGETRFAQLRRGLAAAAQPEEDEAA